MNRRENFLKTLNHQSPEQLILDLGGCPLSGMEGKSMSKLMDFLGYKPEEREYNAAGYDERVLKYLDIDTRGVGGFPTPESLLAQKVSENEYIDEWGIKRKFTGMYWDIIEFPLRGASIDDLDKFSWPDPESIDIKQIEKMRDDAKYLHENTDYVICASHPVLGVFELGCWMCGFDDFLLKMAIDEDFIKKFFDIILNYQKKVIELYYGMLGPYIHFTSSGDDFATQTSSFVSPQMFDDLIKPYFKERISYTKKYTNAAFLHHSCGNVYHLIPSLIDCGVEILNPIQPVNELMSPESLKSKYGNKVCFHGGIDTQAILPYGTLESVRNEVRRVIDVISKDGGYIFAAAHNIQEDVPPQNLVEMFRTARQAYRKNK